MKLTEKDYYIQDEKLFKNNADCFSKTQNISISDENSLKNDLFNSVESDILGILSIETNSVCVDGESFNESFLAQLREVLKSLENENKTVVFTLIGDFSKNTESEVFYHVARRIKDCAAVAGIVFEESTEKAKAKEIITALRKKHPEYVYFTQTENLYAELNSLYEGRIGLL